MLAADLAVCESPSLAAVVEELLPSLKPLSSTAVTRTAIARH